MTTPTTVAGRALFTDNEPMDMYESNGVTPEDVVAIEAEAAAPVERARDMALDAANGYQQERDQYREALERLVAAWDTEPAFYGSLFIERLDEARALMDGSVGSGQTEGLRREVGE